MVPSPRAARLGPDRGLGGAAPGGYIVVPREYWIHLVTQHLQSRLTAAFVAVKLGRSLRAWKRAPGLLVKISPRRFEQGRDCAEDCRADLGR